MKNESARKIRDSISRIVVLTSVFMFIICAIPFSIIIPICVWWTNDKGFIETIKDFYKMIIESFRESFKRVDDLQNT